MLVLFQVIHSVGKWHDQCFLCFQAQKGSAGTAGWYVIHSIHNMTFCYSLCTKPVSLSVVLYTEAPEDPMASMLAKIRSGGVQLKKVTAVSIYVYHCAYYNPTEFYVNLSPSFSILPR